MRCVLVAQIDQAKAQVLRLLIVNAGIFSLTVAVAAPVGGIDDMADSPDKQKQSRAPVVANSTSLLPKLTLEQLQQQIEQLQKDNRELIRRQQALELKIHDDLERSAMAQDLAQDLDSQYHQALRISGYADVEANFEKDANYMRLHHFSLFFNKSISDSWHLFSEIEYEDAPLLEANNEKINVLTPGGSAEVTQVEHASGAVFLEAMNLDYHWTAGPSVRLGRFFTPAGIWSIDHYPPFVVTQVRPLHIRKIFPQLVDGIDFYGNIKLGRHWFRYDFYLGNGENNTMLMGDQDGNKSLGIRAALDVDWLKRAEFGLSLYRDSNLVSPCSQTQVTKTAAGLHYKLEWRALTAQSEYAKADFESTDSSRQCLSQGVYTQLSWKSGNGVVGIRSDRFNDRLVAEKRQQSLFFNFRMQKDVLLKWESHWLGQSDSRIRWSIATVAVNLGH